MLVAAVLKGHDKSGGAGRAEGKQFRTLAVQKCQRPKWNSQLQPLKVYKEDAVLRLQVRVCMALGGGGCVGIWFVVNGWWLVVTVSTGRCCCACRCAYAWRLVVTVVLVFS